MSTLRWLVVVACLACGCTPSGGSSFDVVVLGGAGGLEEDNLTAFLLAPKGSGDFVALDAGNLRAGIKLALERGTLARPEGKGPPEETFLRNRVKAYLISHAHLDHVSGLIINSPDDSAKPVMGMDFTLGMLRDHAFNWKLWPNMGDSGAAPLKRYQFIAVDSAPRAIPGTPLTVEMYPLSHSAPYRSSAFVVRHGKNAVVYLGDTGPDVVEHSTLLTELWLAVAPLVRAGELKGVFLECSYPNGREDKDLFGHLTPAWFMEELERLARTVNAQAPQGVLRGLPVVVTHIKPGLVDGKDTRDLVAQQLERANQLGLRLVVPRQGDRLSL